MTTPQAAVIHVSGAHVTIQCPYCHGRHRHKIADDERHHRFAPGCGMNRSATDRTTGYTFEAITDRTARTLRATTKGTPK